jgi:queuine tRNA-ribosyltransferase
MLSFSLTHHDALARTGTITTAHGRIDTPNFMTVATQGAIKGLTPEQAEALGAQVLLMNAFHLAWRPGEQLVKELGGLHKFSGWPRPILTDSGGYQVFSLPGLRKITDEGALFASPLDGSVRMFSPETVVDIQCALRPDMAMILDECPPQPCSPADLTRAVDRSLRWAERACRHAQRVAPPDVNFFGIVQGGLNDQERQRSLDGTAALPFPGLALGGFAVGEAPEETHRALAFIAPKMPADRPRYLMGMGTPEDLLVASGHGVDLFDCTLPTRSGRTGLAFTSRGKLKIANARHTHDAQPLDAACGCYTCRNFSRGFLRHLFLAREMNAAILMTLHNLAFYLGLMCGIRAAIAAGRLAQYQAECFSQWNRGEND